MSYNKNENDLPANNSSRQMETGGSYIRYSEMFAKCKIGRCMANYLACIKQLNDLSNSFYDAISEEYGEIQADKLNEDKFCQKRNELESVMFGFVQDSITAKIICNEVSEI